MAEYRNVLQYGDQAFEWDPTQQVFSGGIQENAPGYLTELLGYRDRLRAGQTRPWEAEQYAQWEQQARAIPTRDIASLTSGWQGDLQGQWTDSGWQAGAQDWWTQLDPGSPDSGPIMLAIRDKMDAGTATPQERALYGQTLAMAQDWNWRASVPQASDANPFGMGDQFMMALAALTAAAGGAASFGAFGAAGAAGAGAAGAGAGAAAGASAPSLLGVPLSTLSTIGQIGTYGGMGANVLGAATDQDWLQQLGLGLGVTGGLAGGLAGLGSVLNTGVQSLTDAARLASSAGRIAGAGGRASGSGPLQQAAGYLGRAGQLGSVGAQVLPESVTDWSGTNAPLAANVNPGVPGLLSAADVATQRGGDMSEWDYSWDYGGEQPYDNWSGDLWAGGSPTFDESGGAWDLSGYGTPNDGTRYSMNINDYTTPSGNWYQDTGQYIGGSDPAAGGNWLSTLGSLGSSALGFLGRNASWLGPAASALGGLGAGAVGANASQDAAAAQTQALNRGMDIQQAMWLSNLERQAPWVAAGQAALPHLMSLAGQGAPQPFSPTAVINPADYTPGLPGATPGWSPQAYQGPQQVDPGQYRWTPGQGPRAADYRYTPGGIPSAANYRYTPGAVPTLQGAELLANDPGYQFRQDEARRALEASALARGSGMSGATLSALQRQSSDLASQEYGQAWNRASQQAQMREGWAQQASQMGFGQAMDETRLREQVNQIAAQQGWSQAQAEAAFRETMAQQASSQGWQQALQGQQTGFAQGLQRDQWNQGQQQQWDQERYNRLMGLNQLQYGRDQTYNQTLQDRALQAYNSQQQNQNTQWNRLAGLAGVGQTSVGQLATGGQNNATQMASLLGQLGQAQGMGDLGSALAWQRGIGGATNNLTSILAGLNR